MNPTLWKVKRSRHLLPRINVIFVSVTLDMWEVLAIMKETPTESTRSTVYLPSHGKISPAAYGSCTLYRTFSGLANV